MTNGEILHRMKEISGYKPEFYNKIIPGSKPAMGIRVPDLRNLAKEIAKEDYKTFLDTFPLETLDAEMLHAFVIGYMKPPLEECLSYFEAFIPQIHDWCVNDSLCQGFVIAKKHPKEVWKLLMKYKKTKKEFISRVLSVTMLSHFLTDEYIDRVIEVMNQLSIQEYNAKMGVAWCVATILAKYPEKGMEYMKSETNQLDKWTYNKSIQKAIESYRVSEEVKEELRKMRK